MKHILNTLAMASAMALTVSANAAIVTITPGSKALITNPDGSVPAAANLIFNNGSGTLEFSNGTGVIGGVPSGSVGGLVGALNVGQVQLNSIDGAAITETNIDIDGDATRAIVKIGATVNSLSLNDQTGQILTVGSVGGAQQVAARIKNVLNGGEMNVSNLRFDLVNKKVIADVSGTPLVLTNGAWVPGTATTQKDLQLWDITTITGPTSIPPAAFLAAAGGNFSQLAALGYTQEVIDGNSVIIANNVLGGLKVTTEGFAFFAKALGLVAGSTGYTTLNGVNGQSDGWGSVTSKISFSQGVIPEPSTYALMGLGLVGIALVARRRREA